MALFILEDRRNSMAIRIYRTVTIIIGTMKNTMALTTNMFS